MKHRWKSAQGAANTNLECIRCGRECDPRERSDEFIRDEEICPTTPRGTDTGVPLP
jgi:hypothetical protein